MPKLKKKGGSALLKVNTKIVTPSEKKQITATTEARIHCQSYIISRIRKKYSNAKAQEMYIGKSQKELKTAIIVRLI